jgi:hypothetical protein
MNVPWTEVSFACDISLVLYSGRQATALLLQHDHLAYAGYLSRHMRSRAAAVVAVQHVAVAAQPPAAGPASRCSARHCVLPPQGGRLDWVTVLVPLHVAAEGEMFEHRVQGCGLRTPGLGSRRACCELLQPSYWMWDTRWQRWVLELLRDWPCAAAARGTRLSGSESSA